jgi:Flp pilus assembly CpaF family ATPase
LNSFFVIFPPGLQEAILSPGYNEVCVNEDGRVFVEAAGSNTMLELAGIAPSKVQLRHAVNTIARILARREADETNPILNARLPDGSRVAAMLPPVTNGIVLTQVPAELVHARRTGRERNSIVQCW